MQLSKHATVTKTLICQLTSKFPNSRKEPTSTSYTSQTSLEVDRTNGKVTAPTHTLLSISCVWHGKYQFGTKLAYGKLLHSVRL